MLRSSKRYIVDGTENCMNCRYFPPKFIIFCFHVIIIMFLSHQLFSPSPG